MKRFFLMLLTISLLGCNAITAINQRSFIDVKLIGVWEGEYVEESGTVKKWTQIRNADGTYTIDFSFTELDDTTKSFTESGRWWVKGGLFYEVALPQEGRPDKYQYFSKKKDCVSFVLVESDGLAEGMGSYEFSECLVADSPPATIGDSI
ncbi:hypothetical protein [Nitrosomonas sp.]|uniref:hypothetical protein n=1 Tax=Nitrosomonas sp. TaxID=42353 RepID=UPI0025FED8B1|nr:hypothetical protein [Nitrosomonas sp.]